MKKLMESFRAGLTMYANSLYGEINCLDKQENTIKRFSSGRTKNRKKSLQSRAHLRIVK